MLSNPLKLSSFDDPAVEVAEDEADKEALERQECGFDQVEDLGNQNTWNLRPKKVRWKQFHISHWEDLDKIGVLSEDQGRLDHRCEQLAETKDQHQRDEILMEKMKS